VDAAARRALEKIGAERAALGLPPQQNGPSGGFSNLTWSKPVYAGDTVAYASEFTAKRLLASRPGLGDATLLGHAHARGIRCNWSK
jgi:acyl dehydratase